MSGAHDGGPAFPVCNGQSSYSLPGMTLRDYFAAKALPVAMQWIGHNYAHDMGAFTWDPEDVPAIAVRAYELADAMLEARK